MSISNPLPAWLHPDGSACVLDVHVVPNARRTQLDGEHGAALRVRLGAPAVDGKANAALMAYLAECCELPRRAVDLVGGQTSRRKRVRIDAPSDAVWLRLSALLQQSAGPHCPSS
ncbi:MAG: DUF167 domain-containing protein [Pseudomonadota bacterium]